MGTIINEIEKCRAKLKEKEENFKMDILNRAEWDLTDIFKLHKRINLLTGANVRLKEKSLLPQKTVIDDYIEYLKRIAIKYRTPRSTSVISNVQDECNQDSLLDVIEFLSDLHIS